MCEPEAAHEREGESIQDKEDQEEEDGDISSVTDIHVRSPPSLWSFQHLFNEISDDLTDDEFEKLKNVFKGKGGIGRGKLEKLARLEMFDQLLKSNFIDENNLLYLQAALPERLRHKVTKFAKERRDILYFDSPLETPVAGHRSSNICVKGTNFESFTKEQMESTFEAVKEIALVRPSVTTSYTCDNTAMRIDVTEPLSEVETDVHGSYDCTKTAYPRNVNVGVQTEAPRDSDCRTEEIEKPEAEKMNNKSNELQNDLCMLQAKGDPQTSPSNISESNKTKDCVPISDLIETNQKIKRSAEEEIRNLKSQLELAIESLNNIKNERGLNEFSKKMQDISKMSLTIRKVYGIFDPSHEPITPGYNDLFRQTFTDKIGRLFPQINPADSKTTAHVTK